MREPGAGRPASSSAGAPPPPCYAHKGPELDNTHRTHRLDSALVCAGVLRNSDRCVRGRGWVFRNICLVGAVLSGLGLLSWETCKRSGVFKGKSRTWGGCGGCFANEVEFSKGNRHFQSVITLAKCGTAVKPEASLSKQTPSRAPRPPGRRESHWGTLAALGQVSPHWGRLLTCPNGPLPTPNAPLPAPMTRCLPQ